MVLMETTSKQAALKNKNNNSMMMKPQQQQQKQQLKRGLWKPEEDLILKNYVETHGEGNWASVSQKSGLMRGGKSCRLRWKNYLRPNIKRGSMSQEEEDLIIRMHKLLGNRWSLIAGRLPGRTDNEVKNYWNTHLNKRCPRGKRKTNSHHHQIGNEEEDGKNFAVNKRARPLCNSLQPHCSTDTAPKHTTRGSHDDGRKEESTVTVLSTDAWIEDLKSNIESSLQQVQVPPNYATFVFDEDPFMPYFDSLLLLGALDFNAETAYMNPTR